MIVRIKGRLIKKKQFSVLIDSDNFSYEVLVPPAILSDLHIDREGNIVMVVYYYLQNEPSRSIPVLIGFNNELEREFFEQFITVSGVGPRAAVKALTLPISRIAQAIDQEDISFLKSLPGIGLNRARQIIAKLQGKVGRFGLIPYPEKDGKDEQRDELYTEALSILLQLQYKRTEADTMLKRVLDKGKKFASVEELLNEVYKFNK